MNENALPEDAPQTSAAATNSQQRAARAAARIANIGISKQELAQFAGIDRGTLHRALRADERIVDRTWVKIERELSRIEEELGINVQVRGAATASGETVQLGEEITSTVEYEKDGTRAKITMSGRADKVAEAIRRVLTDDA